MFHYIHKKIKIEDDKSVLFCTDLHGNYEQFMLALIANKIKKDTVIISTGDFVDRGKNSVPFLISFLHDENFYSSLGNHELALVCANYSDSDLAFWLNCGGKPTFNELGKAGVNLFSEEIQAKLPFILEVEHRGKTFGIVHANIPLFRGRHITQWDEFIYLMKTEEEFRLDALWGQKYYADLIMNKNNGLIYKEIPEMKGIDYVLHGHYGIEDPIFTANHIWFDTWYKDPENLFTFLMFDHKNNKWIQIKG